MLNTWRDRVAQASACSGTLVQPDQLYYSRNTLRAGLPLKPAR